jgi:hypothetical protein
MRWRWRCSRAGGPPTPVAEKARPPRDREDLRRPDWWAGQLAAGPNRPRPTERGCHAGPPNSTVAARTADLRQARRAGRRYRARAGSWSTRLAVEVNGALAGELRAELAAGAGWLADIEHGGLACAPSLRLAVVLRWVRERAVVEQLAGDPGVAVPVPMAKPGAL